MKEKYKSIGEKFRYGKDRVLLVCMEKEGCKECFMKERSYSDCCKFLKRVGPCEKFSREDNKGVIFKLIEE